MDNEPDSIVDVFAQPAENILDIEVHWMGDPSIGEVLTVFKTWRHLRRLSIISYQFDIDVEFPSLDAICDFILNIKCLIFLRIDDDVGDPERMDLKSKVIEWVKDHRPNFIFEMDVI
jgi:hypothetical protein